MANGEAAINGSPSRHASARCGDTPCGGADIRRLPQLVSRDRRRRGWSDARRRSSGELLENSPDAGATRITTEVEQGGVRLIRVRDDGGGIAPAQLALALARHATSKIASFEDLQQVVISARRGVAQHRFGVAVDPDLRIAGQDSGWRMGGDGGDVFREPVPAPHPLGTTVEARELFFNVPRPAQVPARRAHRVRSY